MRPFIVPGFIAFFSLIIIYLAMQFKTSPPMIVGHSMQPRSFPIFLMLINLILVAILLWQNLKTPSKPVEIEGMTTWISVGSFGLFYILTITTDFFIAIAFIMYVLCFSWGERRPIVAGSVSLGIPLALFMLFDEVLKIRFPRGIITNWYYG
mgnify:CR=1 FL=1